MTSLPIEADCGGSGGGGVAAVFCLLSITVRQPGVPAELGGRERV